MCPLLTTARCGDLLATVSMLDVSAAARTAPARPGPAAATTQPAHGAVARLYKYYYSPGPQYLHRRRGKYFYKNIAKCTFCTFSSEGGGLGLGSRAGVWVGPVPPCTG